MFQVLQSDEENTGTRKDTKVRKHNEPREARRDFLPSDGIKHWTSTRRGPEALTLKVDRGACNVGSNNPERTLGISELQLFEVDHDTCKILARALPKMVSLALFVPAECRRRENRCQGPLPTCAMRKKSCVSTPATIHHHETSRFRTNRNLRIRTASGCFAQGRCRHLGSTHLHKTARFRTDHKIDHDVAESWARFSRPWK